MTSRAMGIVGGLAALLMGVSSASAQTVVVTDLDYEPETGLGQRFGVGLDLGYPFSGLMAKYYTSDRLSLQVEAGYNAMPWEWRFDQGYDNGLGIRAAVLSYPALLSESTRLTIPLFVGVGAGYTFNLPEQTGLFTAPAFQAGSDILNVFVPVGLQFQFPAAQAALFLQVEPGVDVVVAPGVDLDADFLTNADYRFNGRVGLGGAYYF